MPQVRLTIVNNSTKVRLTPQVVTTNLRLQVTQETRSVRLTIGTVLGAGSLSKAPPLALTADGPDEFDPPSGDGSRRIYLPNGSRTYLVFKGGMLIDEGRHYTRGSNYIDLTAAIGDIGEDDTFTLCEY